MLNALTIDVEEWYHICGVEDSLPRSKWSKFESRVEQETHQILTLLNEKGVKATFFILGYVAEKSPQLVKDIDSQGHEIATHGFCHKLIYKQKKEEFSEDIKRSISILEDMTGKKVIGHRAASFSIIKDTFWALDILIEHGIRYDCSVFPILNPRYGVVDAPRFPYEIKPGLMEFSPSTVNILGANIPFSGGPYFRITPYFLTKMAIENINKQGKPVQIYVHPWELDPDQPKLDIRLDRRFTHYANIRSTAQKLKALFKDFKFAPVKEVLNIG